MAKNLPKQAPKKRPEESTLEKEIKRTAAECDNVTYTLLDQLLPQGKDPRKFVEDVCKATSIEPPKPGEKLAHKVYLIQRDVLKFKHVKIFFGCDGKLGHRTLDGIFKELPQLAKAYSKQIRTAPYKNSRDKFAKKYNFPEPSSSSPNTNVEKRRINHQDAIVLGDSLSKQFAKSFYKGTRKFKQFNGLTFQLGQSAVTMQRRYERLLPKMPAPAYTVWLGTNDLSYRRPSKIYRANEKICLQILKQNPDARILLVSLLPVNKSRYHKNPAIAQAKVDYVNKRMKRLARRYPNNITYVDLHTHVQHAVDQGARVFAPDKLHLSSKAARAVSRLLEEELEKGRHSSLISYL